MQQLTEFAINHWVLVTIFFGLLGVLIANLLATSTGVDTAAAVHLINRENALVIDTRTVSDFAAGHIIDAVNIPLDELKPLPERLKKHSERPLIVCCATGSLAAQGARSLKQQGCARALVLKGGISAWRADNLPITGSAAETHARVI
jgi:rhodanese-related sulfurtransferase